MENNNIKVAYLLLVHNNVEQLNLFIQQLLNYGKCDIYIHVDKKSSNMIPQIIKKSNIQIISNYEIKWASFEMMAATIDLMKLLLKSEKQYSHVYYGSGNDLLVKNGLYKYLIKYPNKIFMRLYGNEAVKANMRVSARYKINWPKCLMVRNDWHPYRFVRIGLQVLCMVGIIPLKNKLNIEHLNLNIYTGSQWWIVPYEVIGYFIDYLNLHPEYIDFWKNSLAPDEFFFQTLIMNSKYQYDIEPSLMYSNAGKTFGTKNHPQTISSDDRNDIDNGSFFCARKFDLNVERDIFMHYINTVKDAYN